jgi:SHS2 domain-containing protein
VQSSKLKKNFRFLPDIATADLAFEAYGKSYSELFENAGLALEEATVSTQGVESKEKRIIKKQEETPENLLFSFFEELIFLKDTEMLVFSQIKCEVVKMENGKWKMENELFGEKMDPERHELRDDVKAATKHMFKLEQLPDKTYKCLVVLDV